MGDVFAKNAATSAEEAAKIVPRAEFRVFGKDVIGDVVDHMWKCKAQLFKARVMPEETYILSKATNDANVKVRDGLLDIKTKTGETPEGFEIFQPRGKFQFPVQKAELEAILGHLQVPDQPQDAQRDHLLPPSESETLHHRSGQGRSESRRGSRKDGIRGRPRKQDRRLHGRSKLTPDSLPRLRSPTMIILF